MMDKGKYEIFKVGNEKVISDSREKVKRYAKSNGYEKIEYKMSVDNINDLGEDYVKLIS